MSTLSGYLVLDLETTTFTSFKRKANPFDPRNSIVMAGWKAQGGDVQGKYFGAEGCPDGWFADLLRETRPMLLVTFNGKFDVLHLIHNKPKNLEAWMEWITDGGNIFDCQLAEYLLRGMERDSHMLSLDEVAPVYGGNVKFDEVKALWAAGVDTLNIDPTLLRRYLCGDGTEHGDIGNTEVIFLGQLAKARKAGQVKSILLNMGSLLATIEMERNGMAIDRALGDQQQAALTAEVAQMKAELNQFLPEGLPFEFKWNSRTQLSALIFGGDVKYEARVYLKDEHGNQLYSQKTETHYVLEDGSTMECLWYEHCLHTEWGGTTPDSKGRVTYASGKKAGEYKTKQVTVNDLDKPKSRMEDFHYRFPRMTEPQKEWAGAVEGVYSVAAEVIEALGNRGIPFLSKLSELTAKTKDLGTYYWTEDPKTGERKGMLTLVQDDGLIHHGLNHTSTVTARFSSSNPNLQNLPRKDKSTVKQLFVSRFPEGLVLQSDFSSLEVYVQAILTHCRQLIEDLRAGLDMHCVRVSQKENVPYEEALLLCKGDEDKGIDAVPEWKEKRTGAKEFSFQRAYGAGVAKIAETTGMAVHDVEALVAAELERYPEIEPFYERLSEQLKRNRKPTSLFVQHPDIRGLNVQIGKSWYRTPDNKLYSYIEQPAPEYIAKRGTHASFSPTEIKNYVVQGTGGEWAKAAMWLAVRYFYRHRNFGGLALLVNQVHDALYADTAKTVAVQAATALHAAMTAASDFMEWYFDWPIPVPVPSETTAGPSMYVEKKIDVSDSEAVRAEMRALYMNNYQPSFIKGESK